MGSGSRNARRLDRGRLPEQPEDPVADDPEALLLHEPENPLFQKVPHVYVRLTDDDQQLAQVLCRMYREIINVVVTNSEDQNEEDERFFLWERIFPDFPDLVGNLDPCYVFKVPVLSKTQRHMVLVIQPAREWQKKRDLKLLLSLKDLYLMGFLHANKWLLFSDAADLHGVSEQEKALWTSRLNFGGGYTRRGLDPDFTEMKLSKAAVVELYKSLIRHGLVSQKESMEALATFAVIGPECIRFPKLRRRFLKLVHSGGCETVDVVRDDKIIKNFSVHIHSWEVYCYKIRLGEAAFEPMNKIIKDFSDLVGFVGVMKRLD